MTGKRSRSSKSRVKRTRTSSDAFKDPLPYRAITPGHPLMPVVSLRLIGPTGNKTPVIRAIVDSGADASVIPKAFMESLGIKASDCTKSSMGTASGETETWLWERGVQAEIGNKLITLQGIFCKGVPTVLLGRADFFATFKVAFDQRKKRFKLDPY